MEKIFYNENNIKECNRNDFFKEIKTHISKFQMNFLENIDKKISLYNSPSSIIYTNYSIKYLWFSKSYLENLKNLQELPLNFKDLTLNGDEIIVLEIYFSNKYLTFSNWTTNEIKYLPKQKLYSFPIKEKYSKSIRLDIYNIYHIYFHGKGKTFPLTLKALDYIYKPEFKYFYCIIDLLFEYGFKDNNIWKDISSTPLDWKENIYPPIKFSDLENVYNKKQLLEKKFKIKLPNSINKNNLTQSYYKIKAALLFNENERQKIYNLNINEPFIYFFYSEQERMNKIIQIFYEEKFNKKFTRMEECYFQDYLNMSIKLKQKISLNFKTFNGIMKEHNKLSETIKLNDMPEIKIPIKSKFKKLKLPEKYELITTKERLYHETVINANCVWSYAEKINDGECVIYSLLEDKNRYTIEINIDYDNNFYLGQIFGYKNSSCPYKYIDELIEYLEQNNQNNLK